MPPKTNQDMASKNKEDRQSKKPWFRPLKTLGLMVFKKLQNNVKQREYFFEILLTKKNTRTNNIQRVIERMPYMYTENFPCEKLINCK